jgi:hypothetical protein
MIFVAIWKDYRAVIALPDPHKSFPIEPGMDHPGGVGPRFRNVHRIIFQQDILGLTAQVQRP